MTTDNFCLYLQNRLIQTSQTGGQQYRDTFPFSIPWVECLSGKFLLDHNQEEHFMVPHSTGTIGTLRILDQH
jgi:hypothetical protein